MKQFRNAVLLLAISLGLGCQTANLVASLSAAPTPTSTLRPKPTATALVAQAPAAPTEVPAEQPTETPEPVTATIKENNLRVRAQPNTNAAIVDRLNQGDVVQVVGRTTANDWLQILQSQKPDKGGWIAAQYAKVNGSLDTVPVAQPGQPSAAPTSARAQPPSQPYPAPQPPSPRAYP